MKYSKKELEQLYKILEYSECEDKSHLRSMIDNLVYLRKVRLRAAFLDYLKNNL